MSITVQDFEKFEDRELGLLENCKMYAGNRPSGVPGHSLMLLVEKLHNMILLPKKKYLHLMLKERLLEYEDTHGNSLTSIEDLLLWLEGKNGTDS